MTAAPSAEMTGSPAAFLASSRVTPRKPSPEQTWDRTGAACSPIPPQNTRASSPPRAAAYAPTCLRTA